MRKNQNDGLVVDVHYGTDEEMLAWCEKEGITPVKDRDGNWDWDAAWGEYLNRLGEGEGQQGSDERRDDDKQG